MNLSAYQLHQIQLKYPLLLIIGSKGFLSCAYVSSEICDKTGEVQAVVVGVKNYEDMLTAKVIRVSKAASELGVEVGITGAKALNYFLYIIN